MNLNLTPNLSLPIPPDIHPVNPRLLLAEQTARDAHAGQVDRSGAPYTDHLARVVSLLSTLTPNDWRYAAVGWLHDILEDTVATPADLIELGIPGEVVYSVRLLTHPHGLTHSEYMAYIRAIRDSGDPWAVAVKMADLVDHLRPNCPKDLLDKYNSAWLHLLTPTNSVLMLEVVRSLAAREHNLRRYVLEAVEEMLASFGTNSAEV